MNKTRVLAELAISIALAVVCSFIKVWEMPQGGSIALTMVPIFVITFRRGPFAGMAAGAVYGLISLAIAGQVYHPMSILLDYALAFGALGVAGFFKKTPLGIVTGTCVGTACRYVCSLLSGALLFAEYAPEGQNPWIYSIIYNATYMLPELLICIAVLILLCVKANKIFIK